MAVIVDTSDFYIGMKIRWQDGIWEIMDFHLHKMGRGGARVPTKLKNLETGAIIENGFRSGDKFERIVYDEKPAQYSYMEGDSYVFMDLASYDQLPISREVLGSVVDYLAENLEVQIQFFEGKIMGIEIPKSVELEVIDTPPGFKGDTVSSSGKPAKLETGLTITVPLFINVGDTIIVDTRSGQYIERAKK
ncbi:MAG TPA: elongation factor P [Synergistaceae bacterium]|jgi:elongation factor P|nr:elongation factor P [Synergistaceae bacterium]